MLSVRSFFENCLFVRSFRRFSKRSELSLNALFFIETDCCPIYLMLETDFSCCRRDEALSEEFCELSHFFEVFLQSNFYAKKSSVAWTNEIKGHS